MSKKCYVVGIGPGKESQMTKEAEQVLKQVDVIVGYPVYVELCKQVFPDKEYCSTPMRKEKERCQMALSEAAEGKEVAIICSGDAGIYGMAGLVLSLYEEYPGVEVEIVPGITAALSGAAVLGAPLMNDFAVISMSDILTPWETIEKRLCLAAEADLVICLYNPCSKKRADYLQKACDIVLRFRQKDTVCGYVRQIGRTGEEAKLLTLEELRKAEVDMFTTVFIGNSQTEIMNGKMVTRRGYQI